jgi:hypothetical protein
VVDESPVSAYAIVILGDDNYGGNRAARAAELFRAGWPPRVIASGRYLRPYASIAELKEHDFGRSRGTQDFGRASRTSRRRHSPGGPGYRGTGCFAGWKRLIVVTSNYHTRRSGYICERALPPGTILRVVAATDSEYDPANWWRTRLGIRIFTHEFAGMGVAYWEFHYQDVQTSETAMMLFETSPITLRTR